MKAARPADHEPIRLIFDKSGRPRYRVVLDYAPPGQPRQQRTTTHDTLTEARAHVASVKDQRAKGTQTHRDRDSFDRFADELLLEAETVGLKKGRNEPVRPITLRTYRMCLQHAREAFGSQPVGQITESDVRRLAADLAARGRSKRTVGLVLMLVRATLARAMRQNAVTRNVAEHVGAQGKPKQERKPLTLAELQAIAKVAADDRLAACWRLTMLGMRRSEVLGLRWRDIDLDKGTVSVRHSRTGNGPELTKPKTKKGERTLYLADDDAALLRSWRARLVGDLGVVAGKPDSFIAVDGFGELLRPEAYSDEWARLCHRAGIRRRVLLHEARHSSVTVMRAAGLPDRVIAAHHGHDEQVMVSVYDHADQDADGLAEVARMMSTILSANA